MKTFIKTEEIKKKTVQRLQMVKLFTINFNDPAQFLFDKFGLLTKAKDIEQPATKEAELLKRQQCHKNIKFIYDGCSFVYL